MTHTIEPEPSEALRTFGSVLKALRERARFTQEALAGELRYSTAYLASIEQARRYPTREFIERAEEALDADRVLKAAGKHLTRRPGLASWFRQWACLEQDAVTLYAYECRVVPGLLQPEAYIRAIFDRRLPPLTDEQQEKQVSARVERQRLFAENPNTAFGFIIEQAVLERHTGSAQVSRILLDYLIERALQSNVEIQIMPLRSPEHAGLDGPLYLAETQEYEWVGYTEGQQCSNLITTSPNVSALQQRYGKLRSQALSREDTLSMLRKLRGEL
ncbi:helix-turn-helix domain-containing protein [Streptomyces oceani]|uniref:DNA-binding protein n=1 Tax=Streptomyces oceani TaxID=1075402 RepID=A0A1E7KJB1_9ACTN|nr:helix-turn-helix transcriptional regulator [Streptomyces oceani]OEV04082.1 DNA-binding protein [Streptomyces oceani]